MADNESTPDVGISFELDAEARMILDSIDEFVEKEVRPIQSELGETYTNPRRRFREDGRLVDEVLEARRTIRQKSGEAGFYAMNLPSAVGGADAANVTWYEAKKRVAASGVPLARNVLAGPEGPKPLLLHADGEQVERYLKPAIRGEKSLGFGLTEPGAGSDAPNMATTAEKDGDEWVIDGRKQWITNAPYADFLQVFARTTPKSEAGRTGGITCFIVERDEYELGSMNNAVGLVGEQGEIVLDGVRIPEDRVLGSVDEGFRAAMEFLSLGRLELGAEAIGHTENLLKEAIDYAQDREAFGKSIGSFQGISSKIARARARNYAADAAALRLARKMDRDLDVVEDSSIVNWFATNAFWDAADDVVGIHGATGLAEENPFMSALEYARILRVVEGTDEIQLNTIARQNGLL